ncbi:MAG TPA: ABC transporter substrate-binding protein [Anaerolineales bacterium]|nr:ABC transporter substrate-binding protein [Anaerolineales bacterium]
MCKKVLVLFSLAIVVGILFASCAPVAPVEEAPAAEEVVEEEVLEEAAPTPTEVVYARDETIYIAGAAWGPPSTWNPFQPGSLANTTGTLGYVYETLFDFDPQTGALTPWLAESGSWIDANTYEVKLRKGMKWTDGEDVTADDVVFTIKLGQSDPAGIWFGPMWERPVAGVVTPSYLKDVVAVDDLTVKFSMKDPLYQEFENNLYNIPIVPEHLWKDRSAEDIAVGANENPVGSGAYLYSTHSEDRNVWDRNEEWWGIDVFGAPAPKRIVDIRTSSNAVALGMVLKGELDLSNNFLPGVAEMVNKGYVKTYYPEQPYMLSANTAVLFLNLTLAPMDDVEFRKALAHAINTDDIVNVAYAGLVKAASPTGLLPVLDRFVDKDVVAEYGWTYDSAKAKSILAAAGYKDVDGDGFVEAPDGAKIELEVTCPLGWSDWEAAIAVIADSVQEAGINLKDVPTDYGAWNDGLQGGTFNMTLNNWASMSNTPWTAFNLFFRHPIDPKMQSGNFGRYENQEVWDLVDALAKIQMTDEDAMKAACSEIEKAMLIDVPMIPLWYNGLWAQFSDAHWTNWPTDAADTPNTLPTTWSGYWQLGGLSTLIGLESVPAE